MVPNAVDLAARNRALKRALTALLNARVANTERDKEERARAREADRADRERRREEERGEKEKLRLLALAERDRAREAAKMAAKYPVDDAQVAAMCPAPLHDTRQTVCLTLSTTWHVQGAASDDRNACSSTV